VDSVSLLLFCIAHLPLPNELNRADCGYQLQRNERKIIHLLYVDDLRLLGRNEDDLESVIKIVTAINKDINTNFGFKKWASICLKKKEVSKAEDM
jgi:hypothetical protein